MAIYYHILPIGARKTKTKNRTSMCPILQIITVVLKFLQELSDILSEFAISF
jgi:hypothetical protein